MNFFFENIFGEVENKYEVEQKLEIFNKESEDLQERDLEIILVEKSSALYKKYRINHKVFTVILIGKDGTEKYRTHHLLLTEKLFPLVDAMPMRRAEIKKH